MKILHFITTISKGGAENHLKDLITLQVNNHQVKIICLKGTFYWKEYYESIGVEVHSPKIASYYNLKPIIYLIKILKQYHPNILHIHSEPCEVYFLIAQFFISSPKVVISKHNEGGWFKKNFLFKKLMLLIANLATSLITLTETSKEVFIAMGIPRHKINTIYYGIDRNTFNHDDDLQKSIIKQSLGIKDNSLVIGTIGRLVPVKAIDVLIKAFSLYIKKSTIDVKLIIVGEGYLLTKLQKLAYDLNLTNKVIFTGFREDIPEIFSIIDIFCMPSISEGLGLVLLEAMSANKAIIISNTSCLPEVVGDAGITFEANNIYDLSEKLNLLEQSHIRNIYIGKGSERIKQFSLIKMFEKTMKVYIE